MSPLVIPQIASAQSATEARPAPAPLQRHASSDPADASDSVSKEADAENASATELDEVVVSVTRRKRSRNAIPNTVKVLDSEAISQQLAVSTSLLDSLSFHIPSLSPGNQKLTSRGVTLRGRTPLYLLDGVPQSTPLRNGERSGFTIDPAFVERVEVIYGANATQGVGATGGIINYVTASPTEWDQPLLRIGSRFESDSLGDDGTHYRVSALTGTTAGAFDIAVGAAMDRRGIFFDGNGDRVGIDSIQGDLADSLAYNLFTKLGYAVGEEQRLQLGANYFSLIGDGDYINVPGNRETGLVASSDRGDPILDPAANQALNVALSYSHADLAGGELSLKGYYYDFRAVYGGGNFGVFQDVALAPEGELFDQSALASEKYGAQANYVREDTFVPGLQLALGADYLRDETLQDLAQTARIWVPPMVFTGWAPYLQLEQALLEERVRVSGGVRWENVRLDVPDFTTLAGANSTFVQGGTPQFRQLLGNLGVVVEPVVGLTLFGSLAQGFTMPDAGLILRAVNTPGQTVSDLVDVQPVLADNRELGVSYQNAGLRASGSYFWSDSDLGTRIEVVDGAGQIRRERTEISGLELSASYLSFRYGVELGAAYAQLQGRFDSDADGSVDRDLDGRNISPNRLNAYAEVGKFSALGARIQTSTLLDREFDGVEPQFHFNGYTLVDLTASFATQNAGSLRLGVQNLLGRQYATYFSQTVDFVNDTNYLAGRGRVVSLTWTVEQEL